MSALQTHGTIAFDADIIRRTIVFDAVQCSLDVAAWHSLVPECYRERALNGVRAVGEHYVKRRVEPWTLDAFAAELSRWLVENVEPVSVLRGGTGGRAVSKPTHGEAHAAFRAALIRMREQEDIMRFNLVMLGSVAVEVTSDENGLPTDMRVLTPREAVAVAGDDAGDISARILGTCETCGVRLVDGCDCPEDDSQ